jgi:hypothetical protein
MHRTTSQRKLGVDIASIDGTTKWASLMWFGATF